MNDSISGSVGESSPADSVAGTMSRVAGGVSDAVGQARQAAYQVGDGIGDLRRVIRGQPLTMGFLAIGIGYLLGHLASRSANR
jgi:hypothetical protein